jgi:hypothetical protein
MTAPVRLAAEDLELLADLVAERVLERMGAAPATAAVVSIDAAEVASRYGVTAAWVREHADQLGVMRLGDGPKPRLRFDPERVAAALAFCHAGSRSQESEAPAKTPVRRRRRSRRSDTGVELLPIRGANGPRGVESARPHTQRAGGRANAPGPGTGGSSSGAARTLPTDVAARSSPSAAPPERGADMAPIATSPRRARAG